MEESYLTFIAHDAGCNVLDVHEEWQLNEELLMLEFSPSRPGERFIQSNPGEKGYERIAEMMEENTREVESFLSRVFERD